jgi:hypothetical protein
MTTSPQPPGTWLAGALRAAALGLYPDTAATELIIGHGTWLRRDDFTSRFIQHINSAIDGYELAQINWAAATAALDAGQLPCSGTEQRLLRLAASIAGGVPVSLRDTLPGLDNPTVDLLTTAIRHAAGIPPPIGICAI